MKVLNCVKQYGCCQDSIYVKRYHNDKINLPSISQLEDDRRNKYFVKAYLEAFEVVSDNETLRSHLEQIACRFYVDVYSRRFHDNGERKASVDFPLISSIVKECNSKIFSKFGFVERNILKNAAKYDIA